MISDERSGSHIVKSKLFLYYKSIITAERDIDEIGGNTNYTEKYKCYNNHIHAY